MSDPTSNPSPEPISTNDLVQPLADSMPAVTNPGQPGGLNPPGKAESGAESANRPVQTAPESNALGKDSLGRPFDPSKFRPEKDIIGRWKNLKGGKPRTDSARKAESGAETNRPVQTARNPQTAPESKPAGNKPPPPPETPASVIPPDEPPPPAHPVGVDRYSIAAEAYLFAAYAMLDGAFAGQGEWMPDNQPEHDALKGALAAWLRSRQSDDLPPGAAFALAAAGYGAKRFQRPNTQTRWRVWWLYFRAWWGNRAARAKLESIRAEQPPKA